MGDWKPQDKCGVLGLVGTEPAAPLLYYGLRALQHRGQESAGITTLHEGEARTHRAMGLVEQVFDADILADLPGDRGVGQVRYSTTGSSRIENAQPLVVSSAHGPLALTHNGDIVNSEELREELESRGWGFLTETDSEVAARLLADALSGTHNPVRAIRQTMRKLSGAYSLALLIGDRVFGVRDPHGIKPLVIGRFPGGGHVVASESNAFNVLGATRVRDVEPGEVVEITPEGELRSHGANPADVRAHCQFEYVYFAQADSVLDDREVYGARIGIGERLAKESPVEADIVVPVPDSGRTHALGYSRGSGIPFAEGLMKNRYVHRTFIMSDQSFRDRGVRMKLNPVRSVLEGQRVILVDDSIVRGTTMRHIVNLVREAGAREVHVRIGSPPIKAPCYLGIDMKTRKELIAANRSIPDIEKTIGADSLAYLSLDGLVESIGIPERDLCTGCLTGRYPVKIPGESHRAQRTLF